MAGRSKRWEEDLERGRVQALTAPCHLPKRRLGGGGGGGGLVTWTTKKGSEEDRGGGDLGERR